jgi:hypothetical protein
MVAAFPAFSVVGALISSRLIHLGRFDQSLDAGNSHQPPRSDLDGIEQTFSNKFPRFRETNAQGSGSITDATELGFE